MNDQELFELRKEEVKKFSSPEGLVEFLDQLIVPKFKLPLVVGYKSAGADPWEVLPLSPQTEEDELTFRNYLNGLRRLSEGFAGILSKLAPDFSGGLVYSGIERNDKNHQGIRFLSIDTGIVNSTRTLYLAQYSLSFVNRGREYQAITKSTKNAFMNIMHAHMGPKFQ